MLDIDEMDISQIENEVHDWFLEAERDMPVPKEWLIKFGKWEQFRSFIDDMVYSYSERIEQVDTADEERKVAEDKLSELKNAIRDISSDMEGIPELDTEEHSEGVCLISTGVINEVNEGIADAIKALDKLVETN